MISCVDIIYIIYNIFILMMICRVWWVHKKRMKILYRMGGDFLNSLPSYNAMMLKFWIWDINKFLK